ncbi:hypothetical protein [Helicobacter cetorum]|uniref:hypothetical protein n=1 Tax=Helicobacter cetorum TaxID=138563 RepID=UPI000CF08639|nr:hypothetical protein [Helicobacter cetorum]
MRKDKLIFQYEIIDNDTTILHIVNKDDNPVAIKEFTINNGNGTCPMEFGSEMAEQVWGINTSGNFVRLEVGQETKRKVECGERNIIIIKIVTYGRGTLTYRADELKPIE